MSKTLIRNPSASPLPLPFPMRGVLPAGGGVVVDATVAQVRAAIGSVGLELTEVNNTPADAFYLGNLLDPVATQAQLAAGVAAAPICFPRVEKLAHDGLTDVHQTLLLAGHTPGTYEINRYVLNRQNPAAGALNPTFSWNDGGAQTFTPTGTTNLATTPKITQVGVFVFYSDGLGDIKADFAYTGMSGTLVQDIRSWVVRHPTG